MHVCVCTRISVRECESVCVLYTDTGLISVGHEPRAETRWAFPEQLLPKSQFQARRKEGRSQGASAAIPVVPETKA